MRDYEKGYITVYMSSVGFFAPENTLYNYQETMCAVGGLNLSNYHRLHTHCTGIFAQMSLTYHKPSKRRCTVGEAIIKKPNMLC